MTYREAFRTFKAEILPTLKATDKSTRGQAWVEYVDGLERGRQVNRTVSERWGNPFNH